MADFSERLETMANRPASVETPAGTTTDKPIDDVIKAENHINGKTAAAKIGCGIRLGRITHPGPGPC